MRLPGETTAKGLGKTCETNSCLFVNGLEMKQCDAPVSKRTFAGTSLTGRLPIITSDESSAWAAFTILTLAYLGVMLDHSCTCRSDRRRRKTPLVETLVGIVTLLLALVARDL